MIWKLKSGRYRLYARTRGPRTGIAPADVPAFILAEFAGALGAACVFRWLMAPSKREAAG